MRSIPVLFLFLLVACTSPAPPKEGPASGLIRINQLGYYPGAVKEFLVADTEATGFRVFNDRGKQVFKGPLEDRGSWEASGERVLTGDFSRFRKTGNMLLSAWIPGGINSATCCGGRTFR